MGRKGGPVRSKEKDFIQFGKPEEVIIEHVEYEKAADGKRKEVRYIERLKGVSAGPEREVHGKDTGDLHPGSCKGRTGIVRLWERDGRLWCAGCYAMRYGVAPPADLEIKVQKKNAPRGPSPALNANESLMKRTFGF